MRTRHLGTSLLVSDTTRRYFLYALNICFSNASHADERERVSTTIDVLVAVVVAVVVVVVAAVEVAAMVVDVAVLLVGI